MPKLPSWVYPIVAVLVLAGAGLSRMDFERPSGSAGAAVADTDTGGGSSGGPVWLHGADGASANVQEHWEKHGSEFPQYHSALDYEHGAQEFARHRRPARR